MVPSGGSAYVSKMNLRDTLKMSYRYITFINTLHQHLCYIPCRQLSKGGLMASKRSVLFSALLVGLVAGIIRAIYIQYHTQGMSLYVKTVNYGAEWDKYLATSVAVCFALGFLSVTTLGFLRRPLPNT